MAEFIKVDALGDACPLPVVKAKKAISEPVSYTHLTLPTSAYV